MDYKALAEILYPNTLTTGEAEAKYPIRELPKGACVTRFAPSPTGFVHFGNLIPTTVGQILARTTGGVFFLRIEDTDAKRTVEGGVSGIIDGLAEYKIHFDEGAVSEGDNGAYGPYRQSERAELYRIYAKSLVERGLAYPCFCSEEQLTEIRTTQEESKENYGYYGKYAACRELELDEIRQKLAAGAGYVLRLRSNGDPAKKIALDDVLRGKIEMPENDIDHVLLKSDGIPTYHFAHAVDDHLMRVTHVIRGDEWLATYPLHHQLFDILGFERVKYLHVSPLQKMEGTTRRKLSKRKDKEAALSYFARLGCPVQAVREYIMTLLNSNFEDWRRQNPGFPLEDFPFSVKKMNIAGALFDMDKLYDVSRGVISRMDAQEVYHGVTEWAEKYSPEFYSLFSRDRDYSISILSIGRGGAKPRKDITLWSGVPEYVSFFFDETFVKPSCPDGFTPEDYNEILAAYRDSYDSGEDQQAWFARIKAVGEKLGYCPDVKAYKASPDGWRGSVADVSMALRVAVTGRESSPDLYEVMKILGKDKVLERLGGY